MLTSPIFGNLVMLLQAGHKMLGINTINIFDAEIVNNKRKNDVASVDMPKAIGGHSYGAHDSIGADHWQACQLKKANHLWIRGLRLWFQ